MNFNFPDVSDLGDWTWMTVIPWLFVMKKAHSAYVKYGFKKFTKILGELMFMGAAFSAIIFAGLGVFGIVKTVITGEIHELLAEQSFSPEILLIGSSIILGLYLTTGIYVFKKASNHYKQLIYSNPLGI